MRTNKSTKCFFAYSDKPIRVGDTIENAISQINKLSGGEVNIQSWKSLNIGGKLVIRQILDAIATSELFLCDLTNLNNNVLFELGYAIAKNKRIWITLDNSYPSAETNYKRLSVLQNLGYSAYHNSDTIQNAFFRARPYEDTKRTIFDDEIRKVIPKRNKPLGILYLKSGINTDAANQITRELTNSSIDVVIDDPHEISNHPLSWYIEYAYKAYGVITHLLDDNRAQNLPLLQNEKYSFISGMALGFGRTLLMLAHEPFTIPLDYADLLYVHSTADECSSIVQKWLTPIKEHHYKEKEKEKKDRAEAKTKAALQTVYIGDYFAENEQRDLLGYFIPTAEYRSALKGPRSMIYVGRKGTGKTANLFKIADELGRNSRIHVCVIKPIDYELEGLIYLLQLSLPKAEKGYLIESLWKFLVYTELALSVNNELLSKPVHYQRSNDEEKLIQYIEEHHDLINPEFTSRMEHAIRELCQVDILGINFIADHRQKVSEILHSQFIWQLKEHLRRVLATKELVVILVDNLDKAWGRRDDLNLLADFLFGLLSVSNVITEEFHKSGPTWREVNLSLVIFLRSDIFSYITAQAREADKVNAVRMNWDDTTLLQRVVEGRFEPFLDSFATSSEVWAEFFCPSVNGIDTNQYIVSRIIPRPRDIIFLCKAALANAINHTHSRIEEEDIRQAEKEYSRYVFDSLLAELGELRPSFWTG